MNNREVKVFYRLSPLAELSRRSRVLVTLVVRFSHASLHFSTPVSYNSFTFHTWKRCQLPTCAVSHHARYC